MSNKLYRLAEHAGEDLKSNRLEHTLRSALIGVPGRAATVGAPRGGRCGPASRRGAEGRELVGFHAAAAAHDLGRSARRRDWDRGAAPLRGAPPDAAGSGGLGSQARGILGPGARAGRPRDGRRGFDRVGSWSVRVAPSVGAPAWRTQQVRYDSEAAVR